MVRGARVRRSLIHVVLRSCVGSLRNPGGNFLQICRVQGEVALGLAQPAAEYVLDYLVSASRALIVV